MFISVFYFRVECVEVLAVQIILDDSETFSEALEVYDLPLAQEFDRFTNIRIIDKTQDIIVGRAGFLFWGDLVKTTYKNTRKNR